MPPAKSPSRARGGKQKAVTRKTDKKESNPPSKILSNNNESEKGKGDKSKKEAIAGKGKNKKEKKTGISDQTEEPAEEEIETLGK